MSTHVVRKWISAFQDDTEAFRETLHPNIEWCPFEDNHTPSYGVEGAMRIREERLDSWDTMRSEVEEFVESGDDVVVSLHVIGRGKTSGAEVDVRLYVQFKLRDGRVVYIYEHVDRAQALEAAGLRESAVSQERP